MDHAGDAPFRGRLPNDSVVSSLVDTTELWLLPVANPDGYDFTFFGTAGARLWRSDNNGDGRIAVDLNRNFAFRFG
jgi:murein tripeptide amidase MpaA